MKDWTPEDWKGLAVALGIFALGIVLGAMLA